MSGYWWGAGISGLLLVACGGAHDATDTSGGDDEPAVATDDGATAGRSDDAWRADSGTSEVDAASRPDAPVDASTNTDEFTSSTDDATETTDEVPASSTPAPAGVGYCERDAGCDDGFDCTDDRCSEVVSDDCDGEIDEQGELQDDAFNCGACGVVCPEGSGCDAGRCVECGGADVAGCPPAPTVPPPATSEPPSSTPPVTPPSELPALCPPGCAAGSPCLARLRVTYRDFSSEHVDFGSPADGCTRTVEDTGEVVAAESLSVGLVRAALPTAGVPELAESPALQQCLPEATVGSYEAFSAFDEWFTDGAGRARYQRELLLFRTDDGGFANRLNDEGEQWFGYENETYGEPRDFVCSWCLDGSCNDPCQGDETFYDGSPVFFPLDDVGTEAPLPARIAADYGYLAEPWEEDVIERSVRHNHFFTSVVALEHVHAAGDDIRIDLLASDDLWVFVNGTLAADLGGRHAPEAASIELNDTSAAAYGLSPGVSYDVLVFAANRSGDSSTFFLKVTGIDDFGEPVAACEP